MGKASRGGIGDCPGNRIPTLVGSLLRHSRRRIPSGGAPLPPRTSGVGDVGEGLAELAAVQVGVGAVPVQHFVVGAAFGDAASMYYQDPVGVPDRREAVRDHHARPSREHPPE